MDEVATETKPCHNPPSPNQGQSDCVIVKPYVSDRWTVGDYDPHVVSVGGGPVQEQPAEADRDPHG